MGRPWPLNFFLGPLECNLINFFKLERNVGAGSGLGWARAQAKTERKMRHRFSSLVPIGRKDGNLLALDNPDGRKAPE